MGETAGEIELSPDSFDVPVNPSLLHQVATSLIANKRRAIAHTKTRAEVRGGGRKPWKQKGTGRARAGSLRSPIFRGGGVIFGPRSNRNFSKKINKKMRQKALLMALSAKLSDKQIRIVETFEMDTAKTKTVARFLDKLEIAGKTAVFVSVKTNANLKRSLRNVSKVKCLIAGGVSTLDLLNNRFILLDKEAVAYYNSKQQATKDKAPQTKTAKAGDKAKVADKKSKE